jgi:uncharacterized protein YndB with AHSA1/START domain
MLQFAVERVLKASPGDIWAVAADPTRFPEWFDGVDRAEAEGEPGRGQTHLVAGPWGRQRFEIERVVEHWEPPSLVRWRDTAERLDGERAGDMWHTDSWLAVRLGRADGGTLVRLEETQQPTGEEWAERLVAAVPLIEARLAASLENLARLVEPPDLR